ncbi:MAG: DUF3576 domain-containing protein [Nitrospiria bacterium]
MKRLTMLLLVFLGIFSGCTVVTKERPIVFIPSPPDAMRFSKDYDKVWEAALKTVPDLPIIRQDKETGLIVSGWKHMEGPKRERLNILVKKEGNETKVSIESHMEVLVRNAKVETGFGSTARMPQWKRATSDTLTTTELFIKINDILSKKPGAPENAVEKLDTPKP